MDKNQNIAIIFAGGSGIRMGAGKPKQFLEISGRPILIHTLALFQQHSEIDKIYLATLKEHIPYVEGLLAEHRISKVAAVIPGGETAQDSIYNALKRAQEDNDGKSIVLIHDGVRPFITKKVISDNIQGVKDKGNAITCTNCYETILISKNGQTVEGMPFRKETYAAQAPQSFYLSDIIACHDKARAVENGYDNMVDACTIVHSQGGETNMIMGNRGNIKVTTPEDVYLFKALLQYKENEQAFGL